MSDTTSSSPSSSAEPSGSMKRRSVIGAALAGTGVAVAGSIAAAAPAKAANIGTQFVQVLPFKNSQPKGTMLTLLGTAGGPQAEYVRTGTSSVLTVDGFNYVVDMGRSSVTQYINSGLLFYNLQAMFVTHLHADHLADYYNYFLLESGQANAEGDRLNLDTKTQLPVHGPGSAGALPVTTTTYPTIAPQNPVPGIKDLTERLNEGYAYSYNVFMRGDGTQDVRLIQKITEIDIPASAGASSTNTAPLMDPFFVYQDAQVYVTAILVPHGSVFPCFAYRFDCKNGKGSVVFSGDTSAPGGPNYSPANNNVVKLAQGADILVHEVMNWELIKTVEAKKGHTPENDPLLAHLRDSHTWTDQVGRVAQAAGVPQLVLTHLIPANPVDCPDLLWKVLCSAGYSGKVHVGNDRDQISLPVRR